MAKNEQNKLIAFIVAVRKRLNSKLFMEFSISALVGGLSAWIIVNIISMIFPLYKAELYGALLIIPFLIGGVVYFFLHRYDNRQAALAADSKGLKERVTTAYEGMDRDDLFSQIQRRDALACISRFNIKEAFPLKFKRKKLIILAACLLLAVLTALIDTPARTEAIERHKIQVIAEEKEKELEQKVDEIKEKYNLTDAEQQEFDELLEELRKELDNALTEDDVQKAQERFETKLDKKLSEDLIENKNETDRVQQHIKDLKEGSLSSEESKDALDKINVLEENLLRLKVALNEANVPIARQLAELMLVRGQISFYEGLDTSEFRTVTNRDDSETKVTRDVVIGQVEVLAKIEELKNKLDALQDEVDEYNATHKVEVELL